MLRAKLVKTAPVAAVIIVAAMVLDYAVNGILKLGEYTPLSTFLISVVVTLPSCFYLVSQRLDLQKAKDDLAAGIRARDEAEAANEAKSAFLATMSHELRTPLNAVVGYTEIMQETARSDGRAGDVADHDRVLGAAEGLLRLINNVLEYSRLEVGRMDIAVAAFDVAALAHAAAEIAGPGVRANGSHLTLKLGPELGYGVSDAGKIGQCLQVLLSNAAKFTKDGHVRLSVYRQSLSGRDWISYEVADTGIGIAPAQLAEIFKPFVQGDSSLTRKHDGAGLGLALASRLASLIGGSISVESTQGAGATFTLRAPAQVQANSSEVRAAVAA